MKKTSLSFFSHRHLWLLLSMTISLLLISRSSSSDTESLVFVRCSQSRYIPGTSYQNSVTSLLSSMVNSATAATFNNFTLPAGPTPLDDTTLYGLFQCGGDLSSAACSGCISRAAAQLSALCAGSCGGMIQFDGCFVRYDSAAFVGVEDKAVEFKRCGPQLRFAADQSDALTRRDALLSYVETWTTETSGNNSGAYRVGSSGEIKVVAQCVEDLTTRDCQDCLTEAIGRLKNECRAATSGDMFLASCYVRYSYSNGSDQSSTRRGSSDNENELDKTLAILFGLAAGVTLLIVFISYITKACNDHAKGGVHY